MAGEAFSTTAPTVPNEGATKGAVENALKPVPQNPTFAEDPTYIKAVGALNHQLATTLATDNEIIPERYSDYENALRAGEAKEQEGFTAEGGREIGRGAAGSGFARTARSGLAARYQFGKNAAAERFTGGIAALSRAAQGEQWKAAEGLTKANEAGENWLTNRQNKRALEAPTPAAGIVPQTPGNPLATAAVNQAFPGGIAEQRAWIKWQAAGGKGKAPGVIAVEPQPNSGSRAKGGPVEAGHAYLVGEKGPEIMVPKTGGKIISNKSAQIRRRAIERLGRWSR